VIVFRARVKLNEGTNLDVVPQGRRFSPNLQFDTPKLGRARFGLTFMEPESRIASGQERFARFRMIGVPGFEPLTKALAVGLAFTLSQGPIVLGSGVITELEELALDEKSAQP
jgi:hypothetical protein